LKSKAGIRITASPEIATSISLVDGAPHVFLANFAGLKGGVNPVQTLQTGIQVVVSPDIHRQGFFLPFMGEVQKVEGVRSGGDIVYTLPPVSKGAVFWYEPSQPTNPSNANQWARAVILETLFLVDNGTVPEWHDYAEKPADECPKGDSEGDWGARYKVRAGTNGSEGRPGAGPNGSSDGCVAAVAILEAHFADSSEGKPEFRPTNRG
jgi:hypothetical protein